MTKGEFTLPDELAEEAQRAGILSSDRVELWLREQLKRQRTEGLFAAMGRMSAAPEPAVMTPAEVAQELATMRAERRAGRPA